MPAQKRPRDSSTPPPSPSPSPPPDAEKGDDSQQGSENHNHEQPEDASDSDSSSYSSGGEKDEFIVVKLAEVRKEVQCPICLGIIRKTRTVMECLHRFCRECIDKSMRLGNNECPACRTHCASRRSLRDDPNYDALIAALYPDIDKYEEEELAFHEEERVRNKQIQASIAQTFRRQAEALGKKRTTRATSATFVRRQGNYRNLRGRRNRGAERHGSDEEEGINGHDESKDSSSTDEHSEAKTKRYKRWGGARTSQPSPGASADDANDSEATRGILGASSTPLGSTELLAWGRGGIRSNTRHGGLNWTNGRVTRGNRLSKLTNRLKSLHESDEVLKISLMIVSLHEEKIPSLKRPYLCCSPTSSVRHLCQYVAMQTSLEASEIEMLIIKDFHPVNNSAILPKPKESGALDPSQNELHLLDEQQTLEEINARFTQHHLVRHILVSCRKLYNYPIPR
ncbi:putative E3 ubiquitin-protein ligase RING1a isoform X2 [Salvia miltiorrhiza]|uniref:putative E3 ubiquitin-protein ligase RING1a isoform X2 n=1 Tax=Salvia miltiorrhiza TaxID=226208 RepID=UPI0025AD1EA2|nr:putative E3 ubiquitin-protein ligase RING1a isoform X2 [Salvia miltiorrhiza]